MRLLRVTFTGANDNTDLQDLMNLHNEFPFVEWGVLVSKSQEGTARFPTRNWVRDIPKHASGFFSMHLCGSWLRDLLMGQITFPLDFAHRFSRMQLNFHGGDIKWDRDEFVHALASLPMREFIFQIDGNKGQEILAAVEDDRQSFTCCPLHDLSHGAGISPDKWPEPLNTYYEGYAGGLGPDNLTKQLTALQGVVGRIQPIWVDMETKVRSEDDLYFDLFKVRECLQIARNFISI